MSQGYSMHDDADPTDASSDESVVDRNSAFDGVLRTSRNLRVEGHAKGEIHCEGVFYVEEGAEVNARIVAANVTVAGVLNGDVTCTGKLLIGPTGRVSGKVATATLIIQEGAVYEGELRMSNVGEDTAEPASGESASATAPVSTTSSTPTAPALNPSGYRPPMSRRGGRRDEEQRAEAVVSGEPDRTPEGNR